MSTTSPAGGRKTILVNLNSAAGRLIARAYPLCSLKPRGVFQDLYAFLIAHSFVRVSLHDAAVMANIAPGRLSLTIALRLIQAAFFEFYLAGHPCYPAVFARWPCDIIRHQLPKRRHRLNPRVVKRTIFHFPHKRPEQGHQQGYRILEAPKSILKRFFGGFRQNQEFRRSIKFNQGIRRFSLDSPLKPIQDAIALGPPTAAFGFVSRCGSVGLKGIAA